MLHKRSKVLLLFGEQLEFVYEFQTRILCKIKEYRIKINKHNSEHLIPSKYYLYGAPQIKDIFKKSVLDMEFR